MMHAHAYLRIHTSMHKYASCVFMQKYTIFVLNTVIRLGLESNNSAYFFIGSYTNNSRIGKFLMNSEAGSNYSPNLGIFMIQ